MTHEQQMTRIARDAPRKVEFTVKRDDQTITLQLTPRLPRVLPGLEDNRPVAIDSLGLAIEATTQVQSSTIEGLQPGDEIRTLEILWSDEQKTSSFYLQQGLIDKPKYDLEQDKMGWTGVYQLIQLIEPDTRYRLGFTRGDNNEVQTVELAAQPSDTFFLHTRGIVLTQYQESYRSATWSDALQLGAYQTAFDAGRVWRFLTKLVRGQISPTNLGGPGTIAVVATSEASQGTSRLLLFLTLLSANLAIVNFLPIPILDGGHMLFLAYEGLFRRPVNEQAQVVLTYLGLALILGLMLFVVFLDIGRLSNLF